jgi:CheY-like chemotaxis protein
MTQSELGRNKKSGNSPATPAIKKRTGDLPTALGLICLVVFFIVSGFISFTKTDTLIQDSDRVAHTHEVISALDDLLSIMKDAETGQRGFLITGSERYLEPYNGALTQLDERIDDLERLTEKGTPEANRLPDMKLHIHNKMSELAETINLRRTKNFEAAKALVLTDNGKAEMDALRTEVGITKREEQTVRDKRIAEMAEAYRAAIFFVVITSLVGVFLSIVISLLVRRSASIREREQWLQAGQVGIAIAMFGDQRVETLAESVLKFLTEYLDAHAGAFFIKDGGDFVRVASYGVPDDGSTPLTFEPGNGLLGQAVKDAKTFLISDVPPGYLSVGSALGKSSPRNLIISPTTIDGEVNAVYELGFIHPLSEHALELMHRISGPMGIGLQSATDRAKLQDLLEETQRQGEELQVQSEELRVSNEELEEQSRALKESQFRLEQQQAELEQTNTQLEEQTQVLEAQRDVLKVTKDDLERQAEDLERTSRFKSDFLANMSHELRTPLNSSLILAKLLADNREENLTEEQVKYAQTIQSAGNDLLALISDILDLSKIESGHMEVQVRSVRIEEVIASLRRTFDPISNEKNLKFETRIHSGTPQTIETDPMRLEQILKNLLSNAMKFTEKGSVSLEVSSTLDGSVAFAVSDTGIGISPDQQQMVFEAFRQADGTTNRKYGGTGLGLSISRELALLLGGKIVLTSAPGQGSTFTLSMPGVLTSLPATQSLDVAEVPLTPTAKRPSQRSTLSAELSDDRERLTTSARTILVVEDDAKFAGILFDLAHEQGFQCLIASTAEGALALASEFLPSAVLLDIGLPDHSGLSVLDRLKQNDRTRHIPVHVVSGGDYARTALALGAVGYILKPVKREELIEAFESLESRLTQRLRRVLVVEDDEVQLESMRLLLGSRDVETVGARSAAECLEALKTATFDCMVLDLSLPDATGFSLLETLSQEEGYPFPPVIVYTGRELTSQQEQQLRKYSKSIIVKGAKSPERLLDEVTLFLHQVVAELPDDKQKLIEKSKHRDAALEDRLILVVEDDIRNIFALTSILEPRGAKIQIARNGQEALDVLERTSKPSERSVDLVLMDIMMPEMDGFTAMREIRKRPEWKKLPIIALTAKAMPNDQDQCLQAGATDYIAKPLDVEKLLSLIRVWMPRE